MPSEAAIVAANYIETLARAFSDAKPWFKTSPLENSWAKRERNDFPQTPGVYVILRNVAMTAAGYRYQRLNPVNPLVLYVGRTTSRRAIEKRLADHFAKREPNLDGSQFVKFLMQVIQDEQTVRDILWSSQTLIACVPITEGEQMLETVERLAMQVFSPRFNIKDR